MQAIIILLNLSLQGVKVVQWCWNNMHFKLRSFTACSVYVFRYYLMHAIISRGLYICIPFLCFQGVFSEVSTIQLKMPQIPICLAYCNLIHFFILDSRIETLAQNGNCILFCMCIGLLAFLRSRSLRYVCFQETVFFLSIRVCIFNVDSQMFQEDNDLKKVHHTP